MASDWAFYIDMADQFAGPVARDVEDQFQDLGSHLIMADIGLTLHEYLSMALMTGAGVFVISAPLISIIVGLTTSGITGIIAALITGLFVGGFLGIGTFMAFYLYPLLEVSNRRANIDNNLPFATMYLSTIAGTGTPPSALFRLLGGFDEYGEVSREANKISRDIYTFGAGTNEAIRGAAQHTPSDDFKELLWGINSVLTTGGDLRTYLQEKSESFMMDYRRRLDKFTNTLSLLVEMYITLVIVGSVFLVIISTIMSALGGNTTMIIGIQILTVFFLLPMAAAMFIVIVKGVSPLE